MKASIMIPTYNAEDFLAEAMDSALNQTYQGSYEVIVVNDGSTDNTPDILKWYRKKNLGVIRQIDQKNRGNASARNTLLREAGGEILLGLDADDILHPEALETVVDFFDSHPKIGYLYTDQLEIDERGNKIGKRERSECHRFSRDLTYHCHFQGHLKSYRGKAIEGLRFNESLDSAVDWDFFLKIFDKIGIDHLPKKLYSYRINSRGITSNRRAVIKDTIQMLEKQINERRMYEGKNLEIIPVDAGNGMVYYDHLVDRKSTMNPETRRILEEYLIYGK